MPYYFTIDMPPAGYAVTASGPDDKTVQVAATDFTSTEDGQHFVRRLEGFPDEILSNIAKIGPRISPSNVDHLLAIIQHDGKDTNVTAYVNELELSGLIRVGRAIEKGQPVFKNDIVDIHTFRAEGVEIPKTAGVLFLFSIGWRKGLFYDFRPLPPYRQNIQYNMDRALGTFYSHVMFQERFSISERQWELLFHTGWFLFNSLKHDTIESIVSYSCNAWNQTDLIANVANDISEKIDGFRQSWNTQSVFVDHADILNHAMDRYIQGDYISCVSILYTRIEGLLRAFHTTSGAATTPSQKNLAHTATRHYAMDERCLLLPHRFQAYLEQVYFQSFDPRSSDITCSRNSVGHGVANQKHFNQKSAIIAILVIQQLVYFIADPNNASNCVITGSRE